MGFRFRKTIKAGPVNINLSKSGIGASVGVKGARVTRTAKGKTRTTVGIPGTGISYSKTLGGKKRSTKAAPRKNPAKAAVEVQEDSRPLTEEEYKATMHMMVSILRWLAILPIVGFMILARNQIVRCLFGVAAIVFTLPISPLQKKIPLHPALKFIIGVACVWAMLAIHM